MSRFVAEFLGDSNTFEVHGVDANATSGTPGERAYRERRLGARFHVARHFDIDEGYLIVRAHEIGLSREPTEPNALQAEVFNRYDLGGTVEYALRVPDTDVRLLCLIPKSSGQSFALGEMLYAQWPARSGLIVRD